MRIWQKSFGVLLITSLAVWALYVFLFDCVVPKTATLTMPRKWGRVPLQQSKNIIHGYFGEPIRSSSGTSPETWPAGSAGKMYFLRIYYGSDSEAISYSIHYQYKNSILSKDYLIDSVSIY